jgi:predicted MFS family arabinose efflux permease
MALLGAVTCATFAGFQMLLSVVPLYADRVGGGSSGAGMATAAFMLVTVLTQAGMPRILDRLGYRAALVAGSILLGLPALLYGVAGNLPSVLAVTLVRGVGFGVVTVVFAAVVVELAPPQRRGEALGLFGVAITVPTIFCNSLGLWLVDFSGFGTVFLLGGVLPLLGLAAALGLRTSARARREGTDGFLAGLGRGALLRPLLVFFATTMAAGLLWTFLPIFAPGVGPFSAASALLVLGLAGTASRWWAGRFGDRRDPRLLLVPGLLASMVGMVAMIQGGPFLLAGALLFGVGFGLLQNATLILTMSRVKESEYGLGSALWNAAFDAGTGAGAFLFGYVISLSGFAPAFYLAAVFLALALVVVPLDAAATRKASPQDPYDHP